NRDSLRSSEAGLKYFVLGALSSGLLLYGCSLIYGATGTTSFSVMAERGLAEGMEPALAVGLAFLLAGLGFKVSAAPFHMWTPDVYEGAPTPITALFAAAPKVAAMALFIRALQGPLPAFQDTWSDIVVILAVLSMGIGAFAAIGQQNIKRLMAYSSIGHVGFALVGLAAGTEEGVRGVLIYMAIYMVTNLGAFVCILAMRRPEGMVEQISDLAGLGRNQPGLAFALAAIMFSLAGIPPLAGFFGKFFVFLAAVQAGMTWLAVIGVLLSVVGAYYYLRIVKLMYFDEPAERFVQPIGFANQSILVLSGAFTLLFIAFAAFLIPVADTAACSLFHADVSTCSLLVREDIAAAP
ncbi:MAG: NADH-quinone oxidoreductase subunit N, partial [Pseudomonadota bacterium]